MKNSVFYYSVGPLLYCPANNESIVNSVTHEKFGGFFSLALCLEDTIKDDCVAQAEGKLIDTISELYEKSLTSNFYIPKIFIRVRKPEQIANLMERFGVSGTIVAGFIIPKFTPENADEYISAVLAVNKEASHKIYMMPTLESSCIINLNERHSILYDLKLRLDKVEEYVLNIRVGGNDLCHIFGFRRRSDESIHSIKPIANIFSDIITVFAREYIVSGPVWEYYNGENWDTGLISEAKEDRSSGFVGKSVIHPKQIALVNEAYKVSQADLSDAMSILNWDESSSSLVSGSKDKKRMNEYKTHYNWAQQIIFLSEVFGVRKDED